MSPDTTRVFQAEQPEGVPPLEMTGERTLPDVPQENYWYQRHLVVYEWLASIVAGQRVIDMACGEGYGADLLAQTAVSVVGVDANPEAYEHARGKYVRPNLSFERELIEEYRAEADIVVFLQTLEHVQDPDRILRHFIEILEGSAGKLVVSTPNVLTLAPQGQRKSENPWHVKEYTPAEFAVVLDKFSNDVKLYGLFSVGRLATYDRFVRRLGADRDMLHRRSGWAKLAFAPLIARLTTADFDLRPVRDVEDLRTSLDLIAVAEVASR
jgi:SAM-dependent methyltransferase